MKHSLRSPEAAIPLVPWIALVLLACVSEHSNTRDAHARPSEPPAAPNFTSPQQQVGQTRQAEIFIRGNDGPSPGEVLRVGLATRLVAWVSVGEGPPGQGPRGLLDFLRGTRLGWRSSHPDIASVDSVGRLTALRTGRAYVVATAHALTASARIAEGLVDSMRVEVRAVDSALAILRFTTVSASATSDAYSTCATTRDGQVLCWGGEPQSDFGSVSLGNLREFKSPDGSPFVQVATGFNAACALTARGDVYCWGNNDWGQLGVGSLKGASPLAPVAGGHRFDKVSMGRERACAITNANELYCWGSGLNEALGTSTRERCAFQVASEAKGTDTSYTAYAPCAREPVPVMPNVRVRDVAVGDDHACALTNDGALYCWGYDYNNDFHESRPVQIRSNVRLAALTSGSRHVCGVDGTGRAYCWGRNWRGQLGQPAPKSGTQDLMPVAGGVRFRSLSGGDDHTCGVSIDGRAYCWGENGDGQLGIGVIGFDGRSIAIPSPVATTLRFTAIAAGYEHTCAVSSQGGMLCWGTGIAVRPDLPVKEEPEPFLVAGPP